jgi:hypothetical protein
MEQNPVGTIILVLFAIFVLGGGIGGCMYIKPQYNVWSQEKEGQAELARAESNRKIAVLEANAKLEASKSLADAEIARARGIAEANKIIGDSLKGNESYLHYLWIHNLSETKDQVIYIPTEANLPILESRRSDKIVNSTTSTSSSTSSFKPMIKPNQVERQ